ncbi:MAG: OmpA family protein [Deltaproteobacteria bacterium]|nr:OmpA family protein [Deltaproteobacteria bacterium]
MISSEKRGIRSVSVWPGYVDALSALLMVVIFVVLIFTISQFLLSEILSGKENELTALHQRVNDLARLLGLEERRNETLVAEITDLSGMLEDLTQERERLGSRVADLTRQSAADRQEIEKHLLTIASLQEDISSLRTLRMELEQRIGVMALSLSDKDTELGALRDRSKALEARLADERELTLLSQKKIEQSEIRIQALSAIIGEQKEALEKEHQLSSSAKAEVSLLNRQIDRMKQQLDEISSALKVTEAEKSAQEAQLKDLGRRLNIVLAREVNRLEYYQSEFFGRIREILGDNPNVSIVGDRFVLQAELLFDSGSSEIGDEGKVHLVKMADIIKEISGKIPEDINWIIRIDGHTDRVPINNEKFASNWELSTSRAVSVVRFLAKQGIPERRMIAAGFSKFYPIDPSETPEAYRKNRRIEIKLTSR